MENLRTLLKYHSRWVVRHWRKVDGIWQMIWEDDGRNKNILHTTGENAILSAFFATAFSNYGAPPANLYLGLDKRASLAEGDTLATLDEISKTGYERKAVISGGTGAGGQDFVLATHNGYQEVTSKVVTWTAGENWVDALKYIFLCTDITAVTDGDGEHLVCSLALSANRTLLNGDKLEGSMIIGLSE